MTEKFDWSSIGTFAELDKNYSLLIQRMSNFEGQLNEWNFPKQTMKIRYKELKKYVWIVEKEINNISKTISINESPKKKIIKQQAAMSLWHLKLQQQKLKIIHQQLQWTLQKRSSLEKWEKQSPQAEISAETLATYKELSDKFILLYEIYQSLNNKKISVTLDDVFESELEKNDGFLWLEVDYLTSLTNMLEKIDLFDQQKINLSRWTLSNLQDTRRDTWSKKKYIVSWDIHKSEFKKEYDIRKNHSQKRISAAQDINETFVLLQQLSLYKESKKESQRLFSLCITELEKYDIFLIKKNIRDIVSLKELKEALWYFELKQDLLEPFNYSWRFALEEINILIREYQLEVENASSSWIKSLNHKRSLIQDKLDQIQTSLKNIKSYRYKPFDSLDSAISKTIKLTVVQWERWYIRSQLISKLEKQYTKQYEFLVSQVWSITSGGKRKISWNSDVLWDIFSLIWNTSSWGSRGWWWGSWWGWRSIGGGRSFRWWWRSSSGWTSR